MSDDDDNDVCSRVSETSAEKLDTKSSVPSKEQSGRPSGHPSPKSLAAVDVAKRSAVTKSSPKTSTTKAASATSSATRNGPVNSTK